MRRWLLAALIVPWMVACERPGLQTTATATADGFPECPHSYDSLRVYVPERQSYVTVEPPLDAPGPRRNVPEYHDCQKFVVMDSAGDLAYDSLFAIFAPSDTVEGEPGVAGPGAEILAWNDYPPLGIERGVNCLYMWRTRGPGGDVWQAAMVHAGPWDLEASCAQEVDTSQLRGTDLEVIETLRGVLPDSAFPSVARWGWSQADSVQTIEVRCGSAWCAVVAPGTTAPASYHEVLAGLGATPEPGLPSAVLHRYRVKGWYDEQLLAYDPDPADPSNDLVPTGILGRFFPHEGLGDRGPGAFRPVPDSGWAPVGYIALSVPAGEPPEHAQKYLDTYGLARTPETAQFEDMNRLYLCEGSRTECGVPSSVTACTEDDADETHEWWGRVLSASGGVVFRCVTRRGHETEALAAGFTVPGTARWRWAVNDEGMWERCIQGCCEMIGRT